MWGQSATALLEYVYRVHEYDVDAAKLRACLEHQADEQRLDRATFLVVGQRGLGRLVTVPHQRVDFLAYLFVVVLTPEPHERPPCLIHPILLDEEYWRLGYIAPHHHEQHADGQAGHVQ